MGVSQNWGYHFGGPNNKDYGILGSILGFPYFGKLTYEAASKLLVCSLLVLKLGRPLSISTFWGPSLNPSLNEISLQF